MFAIMCIFLLFDYVSPRREKSLLRSLLRNIKIISYYFFSSLRSLKEIPITSVNLPADPKLIQQELLFTFSFLFSQLLILKSNNFFELFKEQTYISLADHRINPCVILQMISLQTTCKEKCREDTI